MGDPSDHEKVIEQFLVENNKEAAVHLLTELIIKSAKEKNFVQAEAWYDKLYEVDSMALTAIVKAGEVIETEKSNAIDKGHLELWSDFYKNLTQEETNSLYYGMQAVEYPQNHMVFNQGEISSRLYFIDHGQLKMFYRLGNKAVLLKTLEAGDIVGEDAFFYADGFCTTSVITNSPAKLHVLDKSNLAKLNEKTPGLEGKVTDYCLQRESVYSLLKAQNLERRVQKRLNLPGMVRAKINENQCQQLDKPFKGELLDISASGLAFIVKTTQKSARMLLNCNLQLSLTFAELASDIIIDSSGTVVAVNREPFNEYIIHVEFSRNLDQPTVEKLEDLANND